MKKNSLPAEQEAPEGGLKARAAVVIRSAYDGSRVRVRCVCVDGEDRTQQSFRDECDINVLMKRYEQTGILPAARDSVPVFADVTGYDFRASMDQVARVSGVFSQLDARTRSRFSNDPAQMLDFLADPANAAEAVKLGLWSSGVSQNGGSDGVQELARPVPGEGGASSDAGVPPKQEVSVPVVGPAPKGA